LLGLPKINSVSGKLSKMRILYDTTELDKLLTKRMWANEQCPYLDLIMYPDGKVFPLSMTETNNLGIRVMESDSWTPISQLPNIDDTNNLNEGFAAIFSKELPEINLKISCGECFSSGENGFISASRLSSGELVWLAFFVASNPFNSVDLSDDSIIARSTDARIFSLALRNPSHVKIIPAEYIRPK